MKTKSILLVLILLLLAGGGGWWLGRRAGLQPSQAPEAAKTGTIYSCSMHPQVRSTQPGTCPFCGMALAPLGELTAAAAAQGTVMLSSNRLNVIHVQTSEVGRQPLQRVLRVAGTIEENDARHRVLSAYVDGRIDRLFVNYTGAEVVAGERLATVFSPTLLGAAREHVALVRQAAATNFSVSWAERQRLLEGTTLRLRQMGLSAQQIAALPQQAESEIHLEILAPMSGTVVNRFVYEGQYVKEGDRLFELADFSTMWFRFDAYERDLAWLKVGQMVEVTTPSVPGKVYRAPIAFIEPNLNDPTRSAKVRVEIPNPLVDEKGKKARELLHRLYAEATVTIEAPEVLAVPRRAVLATGMETLVYVDKGGGSFERRVVKLGRAGDELWEVSAGLHAGERVVTEGNLLIDAQAQLDSGGGFLSPQGTAAPEASAEPPLPRLDEAQQKSVADFLTLADSLTAALSSDNLEAFNQQASKLRDAVAGLVAALHGVPAWQRLAQKLGPAAHVAKANDLPSARRNFLPFSTALVEFIQGARPQPPLQDVRVYRCPMADGAFPGAPNTASWIQLKPPLRNPWLGAEMLECGTEVPLHARRSQ